MTQYQKIQVPKFVEAKRVDAVGELQENGLRILTLEGGSIYAIDSFNDIKIGDFLVFSGASGVGQIIASEDFPSLYVEVA